MNRRKERGVTRRAQSLGDQAYEQIKRDIVLCKLRPGEEITEAGLAAAYKFGRAPIRAALSRLAQDRLLAAVPRRGHIVTPISIRSVREVFELRLILEPAAARAAVGRVDVELLRSFSPTPGPPDDPRRKLRFLKDNRDFHMAVIAACGNERLERILSALYDEMSRMLHLGLFSERDSDVMRIDHQEQEEQHRVIIDAFSAHDGDAAERATRQHIESSHGLVVKAIMSGQLTFSV